jgi:hypothetical protein
MPATSVVAEINGEYSGQDKLAATKHWSSKHILMYSRSLEKTLAGRDPARRYNSVRQDWRSILPYAKGSLFLEHTDKLENAYIMMSVPLNEAISLHRNGDALKACQEIGVVGELCSRLALRMNAVLHAMRQHGRHFGVVPNLSLLESANFQSERGQRAARHSKLVACILLSERSQFLNKLSTLEELVDELSDDFIEISKQLTARFSGMPLGLWEFLEHTHFDLNTCLRETNVLLKSFLVELPEEHLTSFDFTICGLARARRPQPARSLNLIHARRMPAIAGE